MPCEYVDLGGGQHALVKLAKRRPRHCVGCRQLLREWKLCDFPLGAGKTCDKVLCRACATHQRTGRDFCPGHAKLLTPEGRLRL